MVKARDDLLASQMNDDELVMMDINTGSYFGLENVGISIWQQLEKPRSVQEICDRIVNEYNLNKNDVPIESDILEFLENMRKESLIEILPNHSTDK